MAALQRRIEQPKWIPPSYAAGMIETHRFRTSHFGKPVSSTASNSSTWHNHQIGKIDKPESCYSGLNQVVLSHYIEGLPLSGLAPARRLDVLLKTWLARLSANIKALQLHSRLWSSARVRNLCLAYAASDSTGVAETLDEQLR
ncbi:unnamed protein product [Protopolystoma xenopodis]|uniref:Uncharacterized protein n=1 Tax=Protopolystoma xenopodis TaxID=117903 RepID=A0A448XSP4_9PLAT|nr:unnamed protein product [Protopolystoma xenopodis]